MADIPYPLIWKQLAAGKVVPFLGAGASMLGPRPDTGPSVAVSGGPAGSAPTARAPAATTSRLPSASELSVALAEEVAFPASDERDRMDLAKVASYYVDLAGRSTLREFLRERLSPTSAAGTLHRLLVRAPRPLLFVVTNYDRLLELAFEEAGVAYDLVVYPSTADHPGDGASVLWWRHGADAPEFIHPNRLNIDLTARHTVFKMHGTVQPQTADWDNFVITEEDYTDFLSRMLMSAAIPAAFLKHFTNCSFLFLGYSLRDWNLRVVLNSLRNHFATEPGQPNRRDVNREPLPSWAIQFEPSELEQGLWKNRGVKIFDELVEQFADVLWTHSKLPRP